MSNIGAQATNWAPRWRVSEHWKADALCAQTDPNIFFPDKPGVYAATAKQVCAACPVTKECLDYAMAFDAHGVWGGLTANERRLLKRSRR